MGRRDSGFGPTPTSGGGTRWHALLTAERAVAACRQRPASRRRRHPADRAATGLTLRPLPPSPGATPGVRNHNVLWDRKMRSGGVEDELGCHSTYHVVQTISSPFPRFLPPTLSPLSSSDI